jgi:hypothetical protein
MFNPDLKINIYWYQANYCDAIYLYKEPFAILIDKRGISPLDSGSFRKT